MLNFWENKCYPPTQYSLHLACLKCHHIKLSENLLIVVSLEWSEHCSSHELERRISWLIFLGFKRKNLKPSFLYVPVTGNIFSTAKYTQTHQIFFNNKKKMSDQPWTFSWQHFINNTICISTIYFNSNVM